MSNYPEKPVRKPAEKVWIPAGKPLESRTATSARLTNERAECTNATCASGERAVKTLESEEVRTVISRTSNRPQGRLSLSVWRSLKVRSWAVPGYTHHWLQYQKSKRSPFAEKPKPNYTAKANLKLKAPSGSPVRFKSQICSFLTRAQALTLF